jgi:DNA sulfur modification protein DndD
MRRAKIMLLKKIEIENFGPFYHSHTWDIEVEDGKPLILVRAMNDIAKSTILKIFKFCLYGLTPQKRQNVINRKAALEENGETSVMFSYIHEGDNFEIKRTCKFTKVKKWMDPPNISKYTYSIKQNGVKILDPQGNPPIGYENDFKDKINELMPEEISQFFFFDGEDVKEYVSEQPKPSITDSIEKILGIRQLLNAQKDILRVKTTFESELSEVQERDETIKKDAEEHSKIKTEYDNEDTKLGFEKDELELMKVELSDLKGYLAAQEGLKEQWVERDRLQIQLDAYEKRKDVNLKSRKDHNDKLLLSEILTIVLKQPTSSASTPKHSDIEIQMAKKSLENNKCEHCKENLTSAANKHLKEMSTAEFNLLEFDREQILKTIREDTNLAGASVIHSTLLATGASLDGDVSSCQDALNKNKEKLKESSELEAEEVKNKQSKFDKLTGEYGIKLNDHNEREVELKKNMREWVKEQQLLSSRSDELPVIKAQAIVNICQKTWEAYTEIIDSIVDSERENIAKQMSDTFTQHLTNNPELYTGLELDEDYHLLVKQMGFDPIPAWKMEPSSGMSAMIAFSFIRALNSHSQTKGPIVIDTPTGRLDPVHSDKIINYWKNFGEQVFILYQPNEISEKQIKAIEPYISKHFEAIRKPEAVEQSILKKWDGNA